MENPVSPKKLAGRYEVRQILGQGGMGLVYRAYDTVVRREVAVKTILDIPDPASLQLFYKECDVLASMSHPNIVEIFDIGEFEEEGKKKPYFVMPLLPGTTLDHFVRKSSHHLTVERTVDIFSLSVVCYEALTGRHPFQRTRADEVVEAILNQIPPPASEVNSAISQAVSRVVHKGMAKQAWHRFASAREFGDTLSKALR